MISPENMKKITSNETLAKVSIMQLSEILCELDIMGAFVTDTWISKESEVTNAL